MSRVFSGPRALVVAWAVLASASIATDGTAKSIDTVRVDLHVDRQRGGQVHCSLYDSEDDWLSQRVFRSTRATVERSWVRCVFRHVPRGRFYAVAALHDEDGDGDMDTNFLGLPTEGYAATRNAHRKGIGAPDWDDASFRYRGDVSTHRASMKY